MPSIYNLKVKFQKILRPLLLALHRAKVTPNQMTWTALFGSLIVGALCLKVAENFGWLLILPFWLFIRMALNALDGMMARDFNLKTPLGQILNEAGDVISDAGLYLPLAMVNTRALWPVVFFVLGGVMTEFCGVLGQAMGATRHYEGPMGKSDRAFFVGSLALAAYFFPCVVEYWNYIFGAAVVLSLLTCRNRVLAILKELRCE